MSKTTKVNVVKIDTDPATTSLKDLRQKLKEFKDEMASLDEGSDKFLEVAQKAGEVKHQLDEINESVKGASSDFGDMVGNISSVTAGLVGAFSAVTGGLQALGLENKSIEESIKRLQGLMAVVQGLSSIDTAIKSLNKLQKSITSTTAAAKLLKAALQPKVFLAISAAIAAVTVVLGKFREKQEEAARIQEEYNKKIEKENQLRRESNVKDFLRNLNTELRIKEAIASVKYEDDELKYKKEMLKEYILEMNRAKLELDNVLAVGNSSAWALAGKDYETERKKWSEYAEQMRTLVQQTKDDIKVLEAKANAVAKKPKKSSTTDTDEETTKKLAEGNKLLDIRLEKLQRNGLEEKEFLEETLKIEKERLELYNLYEEDELKREKQLTAIYELEQKIAELGKPTEETTEGDDELELRKKYLRDIADGYLQYELSAKESYERDKNALKEALDQKIITQEEYNAASIALEKKRSREIAENTINIVSSSSQLITGLLDGIASQQDTNNREGFEKSKKLQIASATIQMLTGITTALAGAFTTKSGPWDIALAAIQAATIATAGGLNINKIKSTTYQGGGSASVNSSAVQNTIIPPLQYTNAVQGANTEGAIKNAKVYVTETDITNTVNKVSVQETENTY